MIALTLARKPLVGSTVASNARAHGTSAINIEGCRVPYRDETDKVKAFPGGVLTSMNPGQPNLTGIPRRQFTNVQPSAGRWPSNLILSGHAPQALDDQSGVLTSGSMKAGTQRTTSKPAFLRGGLAPKSGAVAALSDFGGDSGGASRFFKVFK